MFALFSRKSIVLSALLVAGVFTAAGCPGGGGANQNVRGVGDEPGGVKLGLGDIAVAPTGDYVVFQGESNLTVGEPDGGEVRKLPVLNPTRLAFANESDVVYVGSGETGSVHAIDAVDGETKWKHEVGSASDVSTRNLRLASDDEDIRVLIASKRKLDILDAGRGDVIRSYDFDQHVVDLQVHPDGRRALVVLGHTWDAETPQAGVVVIDLKTGDSRHIDVPNCADVLAITGDGEHALLAPTTCQKDPVSVIALDNGEEHFVRNLPGFGPVAVAPDGIRAVAFLDTHNVDEALFDDPSQVPSTDIRYHLMVINTTTMDYTFHPVGRTLPRYAMTNDGRVVLVDSAAGNSTQIFDLETGKMKSIGGPAVRLDNFALSSDSAHAYGLKMEPPVASDEVVFHIDIREEQTRFLNAPFIPQNINISADDSHLFLRRSNKSICVFSIDAQECDANMHLGDPEEIDDSYQIQSW